MKVWYFCKDVILTNDNLVKRNWHESTPRAFCQHDKTIKHIFFQSKFAHSIWLVIHVVSKLFPPSSVLKKIGS
jgi:hypothetical protein